MILAQQDARPLIQWNMAPLFEEHGLPLAVMGILVVFVALSLVIAFITALPRLLPADKASVPATPSLAVDSGDELAEETVAVIAAAVAAILDRPHRILKISGATPADLGWSLEGRMQLHHSHRIQRGKP